MHKINRNHPFKKLPLICHKNLNRKRPKWIANKQQSQDQHPKLLSDDAFHTLSRSETIILTKSDASVQDHGRSLTKSSKVQDINAYDDQSSPKPPKGLKEVSMTHKQSCIDKSSLLIWRSNYFINQKYQVIEFRPYNKVRKWDPMTSEIYILTNDHQSWLFKFSRVHDGNLCIFIGVR